jgi:integrase
MSRSRSGGIYERFERHADRSFGEAAARYLSEFKGKPSSKRRAAAAIDSVIPYIGKLRCIEVNDEALLQFKEDRFEGRRPFKRPAMVNTVNKELTQVVTIMRKAARVWQWIPWPPAVEHLKGAERQPYPLTWEEQEKLFRCLPTGWDVGAGCFLINTGCRKEEMFGLKWTDRRWIPELDIKSSDGTVKERMYVFVLNETKNGQSRALVLNAIARRAVEHQRKWQMKYGQSEWVFPSNHRGFRGSKVRSAGKVWDRAWRDAGLPSGPLVKKGMHNCRHTFAHRLRAAGVPQEDRNALLGHARTNLAEHYATPDIERLLMHAEKICERKETTVLRSIG